MAEQKPMSTLLTGHTVLITGASRGIGAATARRMAAYGAAVGVNYHRNRGAAERVVGDITALGGTAVAVQANVGDPDQVEEMVERTEERLGPVDTLVANATAYGESIGGAFAESHWDGFRDIVTGAVAALYVPARVLVPRMITRGSGNIIAVSSVAARHLGGWFAPHAAGKAAVEGLVRALAIELGPHQIRVNTVAPALTLTDSVEGEPVPDGFHRAIIDRTPLGRLGKAEDVAGVIVLLATDESRWLTGSYLVAGGGLYMP